MATYPTADEVSDRIHRKESLFALMHRNGSIFCTVCIIVEFHEAPKSLLAFTSPRLYVLQAKLEWAEAARAAPTLTQTVLSFVWTNKWRKKHCRYSFLLPDSTSHVPINGLTCIQYAFDIRLITALATLSEWWDASFIPKSKILWILLKSVFSCSLRNWLSS